MRKIFFVIVLTACLQALALPHYELSYRLSGTALYMLPDEKVSPFLSPTPVVPGASFAVEFLPTGRWHSLQQWNNASVGVGATYLNLGNNAVLGSAIAAYGYLNLPFYNGTHFRFGWRPTVGLAAVTKTYANTYKGEHLYQDHKDANWSIGSVLNAYLALELYMDFPVKDGWEITLNGGWHHISNGSIMHPNAGYNMLGAELGVRYHPHEKDYTSPEPDVPRKLYDGVTKPWTVELSATGGIKQNYYRDNYPKMQFFGAATVKLAAYWVPVSIFRLGAGIDAFYDGYYRSVSNSIPGAKEAFPDAPVTYFGKTYLKESNIANCFRAGVSIQPEFIIGRLTAGLHVGVYLYDPVKNLEPFIGKKSWDKGQGAKEMDDAGTPLNRGIFYQYDLTDASNYQDGWCYMQFILKYHVLDRLFVQLGLKTHGARAEFIDAGLGVAF